MVRLAGIWGPFGCATFKVVFFYVVDFFSKIFTVSHIASLAYLVKVRPVAAIYSSCLVIVPFVFRRLNFFQLKSLNQNNDF